MGNCKKCNKEIESRFCPHCGYDNGDKGICPICSAEMSGRFCGQCGYDSQKSRGGEMWSRFCEFLKKNKKPILIISLSILAAILITTLCIIYFSNIFRIGKVSKIEIGMSMSQVKEILGEPSEESERGNELYWYENAITERIEKAEKILMDSFESEDEEQIEAAILEYDRLYAEIEKMTFKCITVSFNGEEKVTKVFFNRESKYDAPLSSYKKDFDEATLNVSSLSGSFITVDDKTHFELNDTTSEYAYSVVYKDGSYYLSKISAGALTIEKAEEDFYVYWEDILGKYKTKKVVILDSEYVIKDGVLESYKTIEQNIVIPNTVTKIEKNAFRNCISITSVTIPESVKSIEEKAFEGCCKLIEVYNLSSLSIRMGDEDNGYVGYYAKAIHKSLEEKSILNTTQDGYVFAVLNDNEIYLIDYLGDEKEITLPKNYNNKNYGIYQYAFYSQKDITKIIVPNAIDKVGDFAFAYCSSLEFNEYNHGYYLGNEENPYLILMGLSINSRDKDETISFVAHNDTKFIHSSLFNYKNHYNQYYNLTSITIPNNVKSIGKNAFAGYTALTEIRFNATAMDDLDKNSNIFAISGVKSNGIKVIIGKNVKKIPAFLFGADDADSPKITSIEFEKGSVCENIGDSAFLGCDLLKEVYISDINSWCNLKFNNYYSNPLSSGADLYINNELITNLVIPNTITKINDISFAGGNFKSVIIPNSVTSIGKSAFYNCKKLSSVTIGEGVTSIENSAFSECANLAEVKFNATAMNDLTSDGNSIFYSSEKKEGGIKVIIGKNVSKIPAYIFYPHIYGPEYRSQNITSIEFEKGSVCKSIGDGAFYKTPLTSINIPNSVTSIGNGAFYDCDSLINITIPDSVTSIGDKIFFRCTSLSNVIIGNGVTSIGYSTFYYCKALKNVTIGNSVTLIRSRAFEHCTSLSSITMGNEVVLIEENAFNECTSLNEVHIDDIASWCKIWFSNYASNPLYYAKNLYINNELVTNLVIPNTVKGISDRAFYCCTSLTSVTIEDGVTSIGNSAFNGCKSLTSVTIPNSVTSIGYAIFSGCTSLEYTLYSYGEYIGNNENPYLVFVKPWSESVPSCVINNNTKFIYSSAFNGCTSLTSVTIPNSVTSIGDDAFYNCTSLKEVHISDIASWYNISFGDSYSNPLYYAENLYINGTKIKGDIVIPDGVKKIPYRTFSNSSIESITIPSSVTSIGDDAFRDCNSLKEVHISDIASWCNISFYDYYSNPLYYAKKLYINNELVTNLTIPDTVTKINGYAFYNCPSLTSVTIPDSVTSIGYAAFYGCYSLTSIKMPDCVTSIGSYAFEYCTSLTSITIPNSVTSIGNYAFSYCSSLEAVHINDIGAWCSISFKDRSNPLSCGANLYLNNELVTNLVIPDTVTKINAYAFDGCTSLTSITIPNSVTSIGSHAFDGCTSLTSITIPDSVTSIGDWAFAYCYKLTIIEIPDSVTSTGAYTFYNCSKLTSVTIGNGVTSIGYHIFYNCTLLSSVTIGDSVTSIDNRAFEKCNSLTSVIFKSTEGWYVNKKYGSDSGTTVDVTDASTNATNLSSTYCSYYWYRKAE